MQDLQNKDSHVFLNKRSCVSVLVCFFSHQSVKIQYDFV